jgi:heptosyltransferase-2
MGEVLRCTPLLRKIKEVYENPEIWWITDYPELINENWVDKILKFNWENYQIIKNIEFDIVYSLDKELICCSLANEVKSKIKKGFKIEDGKILPYDNDAYYLWRRGIDDKFMKNDKRHYIDEIFETCGFRFNGEEYILPPYDVPDVNIDKRKIVVGLNTGTSKTWKTRQWNKNNWIKLASKLIDNGFEVVLLGGKDEDKLNKEISEKSGAKYFGTFPLRDFIGLVSLTDIVVTQVTFALHVAIGLKKKVVLMNNIFNKYEYYFYDLDHIILEPNVPCKMCYKSNFDEDCYVKNCMDLIEVDDVFNSINELCGK